MYQKLEFEKHPVSRTTEEDRKIKTRLVDYTWLYMSSFDKKKDNERIGIILGSRWSKPFRFRFSRYFRRYYQKKSIFRPPLLFNELVKWSNPVEGAVRVWLSNCKFKFVSVGSKLISARKCFYQKEERSHRSVSKLEYNFLCIAFNARGIFAKKLAHFWIALLPAYSDLPWHLDDKLSSVFLVSLVSQMMN